MKMKKYHKKTLVTAILLTLVACASIGTPDGGPYDEEPPVLLVASPGINATNVTGSKYVLEFDENIKLENPFEKVVVSPPQAEMPNIKYSGKKVTVELYDTLRPNTTYSIDFSDAIVDNNEGNPYENFAYVFSTGEIVDTLAVSGTVLNAADLEPVKGVTVGIYSCLDDSAFTTKPFERVSRTDSRGRFTIKGIAPGKYRIYALNDANQNYFFDQKSEKIAFMETVIEPFATPATRPDTIWRDSLTIDTIRMVDYIRYQPDDLVLPLFAEEMFMQQLIKYPREEHRKITMYFAAPNKERPAIEGLGFDMSDAYILEPSEKNDTLTLWFKDSLLYRNDTLPLTVTYKALDSIGCMVDRTDTLYISAKKKWEKLKEQEREEFEKAEKEFHKKARKKVGYDENNPPAYVPPTKTLPVRFSGSSIMDVNATCRFRFEEPLVSIDTSFIHLSVKSDTLWVPIPYVFRQDTANIRSYNVYAEWRPGETYQLLADSAAFKGLYGGTSKPFKQEMKFRSLDEYAVLYLNINGVGDNAIVQLLANGEKVMQSVRTSNGRCAFYFIKPGTYYLRLILDENNNGKWDTGDYAKGIQPEKVFYYDRSLELRAMFEYSQDDWDINAPLEGQKPLEITKQKPEKKRQKMNRNADREFK